MTQALLLFITARVSIIKLYCDLALENLSLRQQSAVYQLHFPRPQLEYL
jgi:hypothetical protein